jgi:hypothetical protein
VFDVSLESGFSDPKYLAKAFMQKIGSTPIDFRKKGQNVSSETEVHRSIHSSEQYYSVESAISRLQYFESMYLGNDRFLGRIAF